MPVRVDELINKRKRISVEWEGEKVNVTFRPFTRLMQERATADGGRFGLYEELEALIVDWDVTENGKPYPTTVERLKELPLGFLIAVDQAINAELLPNRLNASPTAGGS